MSSLQTDNKSEENKQKIYSRVGTLHSFCYSVKEISQDSQVNMKFKYVKNIKIYNI